MANIKILVWDLDIALKNSGGPSGYLYNWKTYLDNNSLSATIVFLKDLLGKDNTYVNKHNKYEKLFGFAHKIGLTNFLNKIAVFRRCMSLKGEYEASDISNIDLNEYNFIHFHICYHILKALPFLINYKGKIILTSHSPEPLSWEIANGIEGNHSIIKWYLRRSMGKLEIKSWQYADYLMFPVEGAMEPYFVSKSHKDFIESNRHKLFFCPTSIIDRNISCIREKIENQYSIPKDAFIICYIGRHNEIKGYDQLVKLGERVLAENENVYFLIGGLNKPGQGVNHPRWIELGWINFGAELMASSDLFILPNKETYFDIVALEVLRTGTPMMMSLTGGNKYFKTIEPNDGLFFYKYGDLNAQEQIVCSLVNKSNQERTVLRSKNRQLFQKYFTMESFFERYIKTIESLKG